MYYVLDCDFPLNENGEALLEVHNCFRIGGIRNWKNGKPLNPKNEIPDPIPIDYETFRGYQGPPVEMLDLCIPIMSARLHDALTDSGVDNVEFLPVKLTNRATGEMHKYFAFKVIGLVSAAESSESIISSFDGDQLIDSSIEKLVIDPGRAHGLFFFRLAENVNALIVHNQVKSHIEKRGIDTLKFLKPEEYVQL